MDFNAPSIDWYALSPVLVTLGGAVVVLLVTLFLPVSIRRAFAAVVAVLCFAAAVGLAVALFAADETGTGIVADAVRRDRLAEFAQVLVMATGLLAVLVSFREARTRRSHRRVPRAPPHRSERDGLLRVGQQPDDALPRARVVLDLPVHPHRHRRRAVERAGGEPEVPDRRQLRLGDPPVRKRVRLRRHGRHRLRGHRRRHRRRRAPLRRGGPGHDHRRARIQGIGGAVPHVDARRLRGRADSGHGLHGGSDEGRRPRRDAPAPRHRLPRRGRPLDGRARSDRLHLARVGKPGGDRADERQAPARVLQHLPRRLPADADRRRKRARRPRAPLLPDPVRGHEPGGVRGRRGARARAARAGDARQPLRLRLGAAVPRRLDGPVHVRLHRLSARRDLPGEVLRLLGGDRPRLGVARHRRCRRDRDLGLLLRQRHPGDVHAAPRARRRRRGRVAAGRSPARLRGRGGRARRRRQLRLRRPAARHRHGRGRLLSPSPVS